MVLSPDEIRAGIADGSIRAITLDTSTLHAAGFGFEWGVLKLLKQFRNSPVRLVLQEVVVRETKAHMTHAASAALSSLNTALKAIGNSWSLDRAQQDAFTQSITNSETPDSVVDRRFKAFAQASGLVQIPSDAVSVSQLVDDYFTRKPPFPVQHPKPEFPDAIALSALEKWATAQGTKILVVSKDGDWTRYCTSSPNLVIVEDVAEALSFFHASSDVTAQMLAARMSANDIEWEEQVTDEVQREAESLGFVPEAPAANYPYDSSLADFTVKDITLSEVNEKIALRPVDKDEDRLIVQVSALVVLEVSALFEFSIRDFIDKDMVPIGSAYGETEVELEAELILTFVGLPDEPELENVEVEFGDYSRWLKFNDVTGPDYSDHD